MKMIILMVVLVLSFSALTHEEEVFAQAEEIIKNKTSCSQLNEVQLEAIGDYYMEQMHPGELHERMDNMMGGEGSEQLRQIHINMARSFYCGEQGAVPGNMMNTMMGRGGMGGIMNYSLAGSYWSLGNLLYTLLLIGIVILIYFWIMKLWRESRRGRKK